MNTNRVLDEARFNEATTNASTGDSGHLTPKDRQEIGELANFRMFKKAAMFFLIMEAVDPYAAFSSALHLGFRIGREYRRLEQQAQQATTATEGGKTN